MMRPKSSGFDSELDFESFLADYRDEVDHELLRFFPPQAEKIVEACLYSLMLPSKRLRPVFCLETCRALSGETEKALPAAMALEMVHTYSLIHDDLPAMDNDDLRRGKPTNHKVFGEAMAILAGDGLLTSAFEVLSSWKSELTSLSPLIRMRWARELARSAGISGMVLGQALDMNANSSSISVADLEQLHRKKTGALLAASVTLGAIAADAPESVVEELREFAFDMGLAFQIRDDVLDYEGGSEIGKPRLSDEKNSKATYVTLLGLPSAKEAGEKWYQKALSRLSSFRFPYPHRLEELTRFVVERKL